MIGVVANPGQGAAVEEFFELFKTPCEVYQQGGAYDPVITTCDLKADVSARLLVIYGVANAP